MKVAMDYVNHVMVSRAVNEYPDIRISEGTDRLYLGEDEYSFKQIICPLTLSKYAGWLPTRVTVP